LLGVQTLLGIAPDHLLGDILECPDSGVVTGRAVTNTSRDPGDTRPHKGNRDILEIPVTGKALMFRQNRSNTILSEVLETFQRLLPHFYKPNRHTTGLVGMVLVKLMVSGLKKERKKEMEMMMVTQGEGEQGMKQSISECLLGKIRGNSILGFRCGGEFEDSGEVSSGMNR
jgi:hypothetical protein